MNPNQRRPDETLQQHKERMREQNKAAKGKIGRLLWDSATKGTYVRARDGELK